MKKRVLIGSCGGLAGSYLVRQFKKNEACYVFGADAGTQNVTRHFADEFVRLPPAKDPEFCAKLVETLTRNRIDFYFPTHSQEIKAVSQNEKTLRERWSGNFIVSPFETFLKLDDKRYANRNLLAAGIPAPKRLDGFENVTYPVFMKLNEGSGSRKAQLIETVVLHKEYSRLDPNCSFYEVIDGAEYTVDCVFDTAGRLIAYNQRIRIKSMGGAVIITQNDYDFDILPYLKKLESSFLFKGCVNFQYILSNGTPYFIDVNLRYASGGLPLTVASGIDVPRILLDLLDGRQVRDVKSCSANHLTMYRYFEELFEGPIP